jgi:hypothetical protein
MDGGHGRSLQGCGSAKPLLRPRPGYCHALSHPRATRAASPIFAGLFGEEEGNAGSHAPVGAAFWAFDVLVAAKLEAVGLLAEGNEFTQEKEALRRAEQGPSCPRVLRFHELTPVATPHPATLVQLHLASHCQQQGPVWMAPALQGFSTVWLSRQVQSCVRPVDAVMLNRWP